MNETRARFSLGVALPSAVLALILVPYLLVRSELPDRVASHFDGSGTPDGSMSPGSFILVTLALAAAGLACCVWLALSRKPVAAQTAMVGFLGGFLAGLGSGIALLTMIAQRGIETWEDAPNGWTVIAVPIVMGAGIGVVAAWLATQLPQRAPEYASTQRPAMDLADGEHAVWTDTLHSRLFMGIGVIMVLAGVVAGIATSWWMVLPAVVGGGATVSLATIRVRADCSGLQIRYGCLPRPRQTIALGDIEQATVIDVRPKEWGGWGYRGSLKLAKQAALVLRAGPGLRLDLRNGRVFVVTVDRPEQPVALLNAEIARAGTSTRLADR